MSSLGQEGIWRSSEPLTVGWAWERCMCEGVGASGTTYGNGTPAAHCVLVGKTPTLATFFLLNGDLASQKQGPGLHPF